MCFLQRWRLRTRAHLLVLHCKLFVAKSGWERDVFRIHRYSALPSCYWIQQYLQTRYVILESRTALLSGIETSAWWKASTFSGWPCSVLLQHILHLAELTQERALNVPACVNRRLSSWTQFFSRSKGFWDSTRNVIYWLRSSTGIWIGCYLLAKIQNPRNKEQARNN